MKDIANILSRHSGQSRLDRIKNKEIPSEVSVY